MLTYTHIHTYIHTCTHIHAFIDTHPHIHTCIRTYIPTYMHTYTHIQGVPIGKFNTLNRVRFLFMGFDEE